jgi:phosphonate transport system ATP-binding protein
VFDGPPEDLDRGAVRMVYGADSNGGENSEAITSTSVTIKPKSAASAGPLEPAFPGY